MYTYKEATLPSVLMCIFILFLSLFHVSLKTSQYLERSYPKGSTGNGYRAKAETFWTCFIRNNHLLPISSSILHWKTWTWPVSSHLCLLMLLIVNVERKCRISWEKLCSWFKNLPLNLTNKTLLLFQELEVTACYCKTRVHFKFAQIWKGGKSHEERLFQNIWNRSHNKLPSPSMD